MRALLLPSCALALVAACNPYDPNLGAHPFRCGEAEPECPDGYECITYSADERVCEKAGGSTDASMPMADAGETPLDCNDDSQLEPNDSLNNPFITPIPTFQDNYKLVGLAICPDTDQDFFRFEIDTAGKNLLVDVDFLASRGALLVDVLNGTGVSIRQASPAGGDPNKLRAQVPNMPQGVYFVQVRAPAGTQNNYSIDIQTAE